MLHCIRKRIILLLVLACFCLLCCGCVQSDNITVYAGKKLPHLREGRYTAYYKDSIYRLGEEGLFQDDQLLYKADHLQWIAASASYVCFGKPSDSPLHAESFDLYVYHVASGVTEKTDVQFADALTLTENGKLYGALYKKETPDENYLDVMVATLPDLQQIEPVKLQKNVEQRDGLLLVNDKNRYCMSMFVGIFDENTGALLNKYDGHQTALILSNGNMCYIENLSEQGDEIVNIIGIQNQQEVTKVVTQRDIDYRTKVNWFADILQEGGSRLLLIEQSWKDDDIRLLDLPSSDHAADTLLCCDLTSGEIQEVFKSRAGERMVYADESTVICLSRDGVVTYDLKLGTEWLTYSFQDIHLPSEVRTEVCGNYLFIYDASNSTPKLLAQIMVFL